MHQENTVVSLEEQENIIPFNLEWAQTFDAVSDLIFIVNREHTIVRVNRAMAEPR